MCGVLNRTIIPVNGVYSGAWLLTVAVTSQHFRMKLVYKEKLHNEKKNCTVTCVHHMDSVVRLVGC